MKTTFKTAPERVYLSPPHMAAESRQLLIDAFDSNWIAPIGPDLHQFEQEFAEYVGVKHAVAVASGTSALHLALRILGTGPGDLVPVSSLTFVATANAVAYTGARPVFIDSNRESWNMDPRLLAEAIEQLSRAGNKPKAIVVVDVLGQCADYEPIRQLCEDHEIALVEDAAEALGATYRGTPAGRFGEIGCFSFNGNKMITTSGGGMLVTDRKDWADRARHLATQARDPAPHYQHSEIGYNYRMSNLLAAIGRGQLRVLDQWVKRRRWVFQWYQHRLAHLPGLEFIPEFPHGESSCWLTCVLIDPEQFGATRDTVIRKLDEQNIESRPCWKPMHLQPAFSEELVFGGEVSEMIFERGLSLPSGSNLDEATLERIASVIEASAGNPAGAGPANQQLKASHQ